MINRIHIKRKSILPKNAKKVFGGEIFNIYQWQQKMFDGSFKTFEMIKRTDTVVTIPTTKDNKIVIEQQEQPNNELFNSFPGGRVDKKEDIDLAALRELEEETGYSPKKIKLWKTIQPSSKYDWLVYFFITQQCELTSKQKLDSGERIKVKLIDLDELIELYIQDDFRDLETRPDFMKAFYDKNYKEELRKLFFD
ncbi:NUDIX hydrolase [Patescibacteria group bacterium]